MEKGDKMITYPHKRADQKEVITETELARMMPSSIDKLPQPARHNGKRKRWVGIGWVEEGDADGTEPLVIIKSIPFGKVFSSKDEVIDLINETENSERYEYFRVGAGYSIRNKIK